MGESITELSLKVGVDLSLGAPVREPPPTSGTTRLPERESEVRIHMGIRFCARVSCSQA